MKRKRGRPAKQNESDFVHTWDDLAHRLGVTRRCLTKWREKFKDEPDFPRPRGDRHDVGTWLKFKADHNLGHEPAEAEDEDGEQSKAYWDRRQARIDYERKVYNFEVEKQKHLEIDEITTAVGQMLAGFRTALNTLPTSAARWLIGMRDFNSIKNKLQEEVDAVLQALGRCDYLQELTASVVAQMFADRDDQSRQDLSKCVDAVHRELGRLALSDLLQRSLPSAATSQSDRINHPSPSARPPPTTAETLAASDDKPKIAPERAKPRRKRRKKS